MKLHENKTLFNQAVRFTAQELGILDIYVEKDYWVTFALKIIFSSEPTERSRQLYYKQKVVIGGCYRAEENPHWECMECELRF